MCGRFTLTTNDYDAVARALDAELDEAYRAEFRARYNIAPAERHFIVCVEPDRSRARDGAAAQGAGGTERHRIMVPAVWGMPGPDAAGGEPGQVLGHINARSETAHRLPAFRDAFWRTRCGVVADGFYEWHGPKDDRRPVWFHAPDNRILLFAGLYRDRIEPTTGEVIRHFAILTTAANAVVAECHNRMPVVLAPDAWSQWLGPLSDAWTGSTEIDTLRELLGPAPNDTLVATEVSKRVNSTRHDDPACITPQRHPRQQSLF